MVVPSDFNSDSSTNLISLLPIMMLIILLSHSNGTFGSQISYLFNDCLPMSIDVDNSNKDNRPNLVFTGLGFDNTIVL